MKDLLTIEEVAQIAKVSVPTIYRRIKNGSFPKPKKTKRPTNYGPKTVNRWERAEVMGWLMKGNDPEWLKQPIRDIEATVEKVDEAPKDYDPAESIIRWKSILVPREVYEEIKDMSKSEGRTIGRQLRLVFDWYKDAHHLPSDW